MKASRAILPFLVGVIAVLAGCAGNSTAPQNPAAPATTPVAIAFQPKPVNSISLVSTAPLTAVVSDDPSDSGVDWALLCGSNSTCGTLKPLHTASGAATTYTPPLVITGNSQAVTVEAFATADHTKNLVTSITITGFAGTLKGTYVFATKGEDANGVFQLAGVATFDGNGGITSGEQTHSDAVLAVTDAITGGSYYIGPDGRGTVTLNTADQNIGQLGVENLSLAFLNSSHAVIATVDNPNLQPSFETSSGTLDLQTSTVAPAGGYAFAVNGIDISLSPIAMGGIMNIDSPGKLSGAGSVADEFDAGTLNPTSTLSGTVTTADKFGSLKFNLATTFAASLQFTGYIVDSTHIKLVESDITAPGTGVAATTGVAVSQGSATGLFTSNSTFAGTYVLEILGQDPSGFPNSFGSVGQFTADSSGNLNSGYDDEILSFFAIAISDSFTGTYTLDPSGDGRVDSTINFIVNGPGPEFIFYLTGNGNPPLVLDADDNSNSLGLASAASGLALPQAAPPFSSSFNGKYGMEFTQYSLGGENDASGVVTVNGNAGTLSGTIDTELSFSPNPNTQLTGTFTSIPSNGRFTGTLTNTFFPTPAGTNNTVAVAYYMVNPQQIYFIETDFLLPLSGVSTFGYFTERTPVCSACQ